MGFNADRWLKPSSKKALGELKIVGALSGEESSTDWKKLKAAVEGDRLEELAQLFATCTREGAMRWLHYRSRRLSSTLLHKAALRGSADIVALLIELGAPVNALRTDKSSALHLAAKMGHHKVVELLLQSSAAIDARDGWGLTPLAHAIRGGDEASFKLLLCLGASLAGADAQLALSCVIEHDRLQMLDSLLKKISLEDLNGSNTATDGHLPVMLVAASHNAVLIIKKLIQRGVDPEVTDQDKNNMLHYGARCADDLLIECVPRLLATRFNRHGQLPLHVAAIHGNLRFIECLLKGSPGLMQAQDAQGRTALHLAALHGHADCIALLLARHASIDAQDKEGQTALQLAVLADHEPALKALLRYKPLIDTRWLSKRKHNNASMKALIDYAVSIGLVDAQHV